MPTRSSLEPLESRIAPANLFVSAAASGPNALKVFTDTKADAQDSASEVAAQALTGATAAIFLQAGDHLIFDADSNQTLSKGDYVLVDVSAGSAMVFLTNNSAGKNIRAFEKNEISGLALSDGFIGTVHTDVNGTVVTALNGSGDLSAAGSDLTIERSSVGGLTIEGQIAGGASAGGHLLTGVDLNHTTVTGKHFNRGAQISVSGMVATGTAAAGLTASFNGGGVKFTTAFTGAAGADAGDINDLTLPFGTTALLTGDGSDHFNGPGSAGGDIRNVRVVSPVPVVVRTGHGGASNDPTAAGYAGGAGGSISHAYFQFQTRPTDTVALSTGAGGEGDLSAGGPGGAFVDVTLVLPKPAQQLALVAGAGGASGGGATGGHGGFFDGLDLEVSTLRGPAASDRVLNLTGGAGGAAGPSGGRGGDGGSIAGLNFTTSKSSAVSLRGFFQAGAGAPGSPAGGSGGTGGLVTDADFILRGGFSELRVLGGNGGDVGVASAQEGGAGGYVSNIHFFVQNNPGDVLVQGGRGGLSGSSTGGVGGRIDGLTFTNVGAKTGDLSLQGGEGGGSQRAAGGGGGSIWNIRVANAGSMSGELRLASGGYGGYIAPAFGPAQARTGDAGGIGRVVIINSGPMGGAEIVTGADSATSLTATDGTIGRSGSIDEITINDSFGAFTDARPFRIHVSESASLPGAVKSSDAGSISHLHLNAPKSSFLVYSGNAASTDASNGVAGKGGEIYDITGRVRKITVNAGHGGDAPLGSAGHGGDVHDIYLGYVGAFVQMLAGGDGGSGVNAGVGGAVYNVSVAGAIGDFSKPFSLFEPHLDDPGSGETVGMGGLVTGRGGSGALTANGNIFNVSASRIAAIVAGRPSADHVGYGNAVSSITTLYANVIGADVKRNGQFDFTEGGTNTTFEPDNAGTPTDGDRPIDGFVLVKAGMAVGLPVAPLRWIEV